MTEQRPPERGAPEQAARPAWTAKKTVAAVAIAVGIAAAGGVTIHAAGGTSQQTGMGPGGMGGRRTGGRAGPFSASAPARPRTASSGPVRSRRSATPRWR
ncbi:MULTISPECIES: hypothetical protein [Lentzea]|uniref:hypothetical protein n=1 Tax=Lentzea TaxID=165301 RepID=UPI001F1884F5|nr:hypothetical protein [Lentzea atacamensis]